jgi:hypothetical protein
MGVGRRSCRLDTRDNNKMVALERLPIWPWNGQHDNTSTDQCRRLTDYNNDYWIMNVKGMINAEWI